LNPRHGEHSDAGPDLGEEGGALDVPVGRRVRGGGRHDRVYVSGVGDCCGDCGGWRWHFPASLLIVSPQIENTTLRSHVTPRQGSRLEEKDNVRQMLPPLLGISTSIHRRHPHGPHGRSFWCLLGITRASGQGPCPPPRAMSVSHLLHCTFLRGRVGPKEAQAAAGGGAKRLNTRPLAGMWVKVVAADDC